MWHGEAAAFKSITVDLQAGRCFPLRLPVYTQQELDSHLVAEHEACEFCNNTFFYDEDEWDEHMLDFHCECEVCDEDFVDIEALTAHLM